MINDPRAVKFSNENLRVWNDLAVVMYRTAKTLVQMWSASGQNIVSLFPNTTAVVADLASPNGTDATGGDGRALMTGQEANNIVARATELINVFERGTLDTSGTQDFARLNTLLAALVNGQPKF